MDLKLKIWRQHGPQSKGRFVDYTLDGVNEDASFLEMLDLLNEKLLHNGEETIAFSHDCREGICGACGVVINGKPHGPLQRVTTCQIHMRHLKKYKTLIIEPWRAGAFPVIKDLVVDRTAFDRIQQSGGYISVNTGGVPDANTILITKHDADEAFAAASCIGCGACVATCPNASAMLFVSAKIAHLSTLPQGTPEKAERVQKMIEAMDAEKFGNCSNTGACEVECPKGISLKHIAIMNRDYLKASFITHLEEHPTHPHHGKGDEDPHLQHPIVTHKAGQTVSKTDNKSKKQ